MVTIEMLESKHTPGVRGDRPIFRPGDKARRDEPGNPHDGEIVTIRSYHVSHASVPEMLCHEYTIDADPSQKVYCYDASAFVPHWHPAPALVAPQKYAG